ncbi:hypothetical protein AK812_SmicGene11308 [Symbiodinium microadriaticum]|uniref:Uncharacterized protein n=1 Tax=Symbiodinium microadriaticum TaxID=2951 RepID=A0A1Q9EDJ3_SYMMI|nr:hypothetical protein AK812_SmicGene11308 [Symbiodinium microadriaticum]
MMRLAVLLLIAFAQRLCGAEDVCDGLVSEAVSFVPVVGNVRDLGCGLQKSDAWEVASGVGGLVANVVSFGAYSSAEAAAKVAKAVRAGKKESHLMKAFYERIAWVQLQHLRVVVEKLSKLLVERQEELKIARTRQELQKDGSLTQNEAIEECLKKGKMKHRPTGLMMFFAKELGKPLKWMRQRHMEVSFSKDLVFSGSDSVSTPLSLMVADITNRFKQKMLQKRMTLKEGKVDGFDDVSSAEEEAPAQVGVTEAAVDMPEASATEQAAVETADASLLAAPGNCPPVDAAQALEDLFGLAKAQETLEQTSSSLLLQLSAVPGAQDAVASFADLLEDCRTAHFDHISFPGFRDTPLSVRSVVVSSATCLIWRAMFLFVGSDVMIVEQGAVTAVLEAFCTAREIEGALPNLSAEPEVDEAGNEVGEASPISTKDFRISGWSFEDVGACVAVEAISEAAAEAVAWTGNLDLGFGGQLPSASAVEPKSWAWDEK